MPTGVPAEITYDASCETDAGGFRAEQNGYLWMGGHVVLGLRSYTGWLLKFDVNNLPADLNDIENCILTLEWASTNTGATLVADMIALDDETTEWANGSALVSAVASANTATTTPVVWTQATRTANNRDPSPDLSSIVIEALGNATEVSGYKYIALFADCYDNTVNAGTQVRSNGSASSVDRPTFTYDYTATINVDITLGEGTATAALAIGAVPGDGNVYRDDAYIATTVSTHDGYGDDTNRTGRLFVPLDGAATHPLMVWCNGGSYITVDPDGLKYDALSGFGCDGGYAILSVDYKTTDIDATWPEPVQDVLSALSEAMSWTEIDSTQRWAIGGHSAGAGLAMWAATTASKGVDQYWPYEFDDNGNRTYNYYTESVSGEWNMGEGNSDRFAHGPPKFLFAYSPPTDFDVLYDYNAGFGYLLRDPIETLLGGDTSNTFDNSYNPTRDGDHHNGELNVTDYIRGEGPSGSETYSMYYRPPVVDLDDTGTIIPDGRHLPNFPMLFAVGINDLVIGNGDGNVYGLEDALVTVGYGVSFASGNPSNGDVNGPDGRIVTYGVATDDRGGLTELRRIKPGITDAFGHDTIYEESWSASESGWIRQRTDVIPDFLTQIDQKVGVYVPAPLAGAALPTYTVEESSGPFEESVAGATAPVGALGLEVQTSAAGATAPAADVTLDVDTTLAGTTAPTGAETLEVATALDGTTAPAGASALATELAPSGTTAPVGAPTLDVDTTLAGTTAPAGALTAEEPGAGGSAELTATDDVHGDYAGTWIWHDPSLNASVQYVESDVTVFGAIFELDEDEVSSISNAVFSAEYFGQTSTEDIAGFFKIVEDVASWPANGTNPELGPGPTWSGSANATVAHTLTDGVDLTSPDLSTLLQAAADAATFTAGKAKVAVLFKPTHNVGTTIPRTRQYHSLDSTTETFNPTLSYDYGGSGGPTEQAAAGASAPVGVLEMSTALTPDGVTAPAGVPVKLVGAGMAGATAPVGALSVVKALLLSVAGVVSSVGALLRSTGTTPDGTTAPAGAIGRDTSNSPSGATAPSGGTRHAVASGLAGVLGAVGTLATETAGVVQRTFTGAMAAAGALLRGTSTTTSGTTGPTGAPAKAVETTFEGATAPSGATSAVKALLLTVTGTMSATGTLLRDTARNVAGTVGAAGALATEHTVGLIQQAVGGAMSAVGSIVRAVSANPSGSMAPTGAPAKSVTQSLASAIAAVGSLVATSTLDTLLRVRRSSRRPDLTHQSRRDDLTQPSRRPSNL